jgi:two-component system, chemotaxis family, chemotaxis protein CheY
MPRALGRAAQLYGMVTQPISHGPTASSPGRPGFDRSKYKPMALNVLVVDDSAVMRSMIIRTLKLAGLPIGEVHQASNGQEGLAVLEKHWVDLALVDINMPVMNGEEMIDRTRQNSSTADLPIVVVSTESSAARIGNLRSKGVEFIHKPFTPEDLRQKIVRLTGVTADEQPGRQGPVSSGGGDF